MVTCGCVGEFLALTGARLTGKELVAAGLATHFVPLEVIFSLFVMIFFLEVLIHVLRTNLNSIIKH